MRPLDLEPEILSDEDLALPEVGSDLPPDDRPIKERALEWAEKVRLRRAQNPPSPSPPREASGSVASAPLPAPKRLMSLN